MMHIIILYRSIFYYFFLCFFIFFDYRFPSFFYSNFF
nr:MAG TPA: hypothetical protein [Caudoviricetes sp.]